jgi:hypothetical protein
MSKPRFALIPFWTGLLLAFAFASVGTWSLMKVLNTHSFTEVAGTAWNMEGVLFRIWAFAVPLGSLLAVIGALVYVKANRVFIWTLGVVFPVIVVTTIQDQQERIAGSLKLIGYLFWINASWYLCGDTAKLHLKAFEGTSVPSPTETMVFLVLGWFFVALGEYRSVKID